MGDIKHSSVLFQFKPQDKVKINLASREAAS